MQNSVSISSTSEEVQSLPGQSLGVRFSTVSISSTSEEVQRCAFTKATTPTARFPLVQLPKKFKDMYSQLSPFIRLVSISSTSEEVQRVILLMLLLMLFLVSISSTSEEVQRVNNAAAPGSAPEVFPLVQLPKKFKAKPLFSTGWKNFCFH